jgi:hypothetical protein
MRLCFVVGCRGRVRLPDYISARGPAPLDIERQTFAAVLDRIPSDIRVLLKP